MVGRLLAPRLSEILGQQVVVENKPGATGNIGTAMVADAKPDGYTICFSASTMAMAPALYGKALGYDPVNGLAAIAYVASVPLILLAPMDGAKTTPELVSMLRKDPGKYSYASSGNGGMIHLASYLFATRAGGDALHVPYRGSAPGMVDMIAGRHGFQIDTLQSSKGFIDGGKVRVLGVAADKRLPQLPDVPTVKESTGFDYSINTWYAVYAPAKTPRPIIDKLNAAFNQALKQPDMKKKADELAIELVRVDAGAGQEVLRRPDGLLGSDHQAVRCQAGVTERVMIKFYWNTAPNPTKVALCLEEMGLPYELVPVDTRKGEQHAPEFLAINPNAKVPAIIDDGQTIFDSNAILLYLAEKTGEVPAGQSRARRDAVVADVRGLGHRPLLGPGRALPQLRARAQGLRRRPLHLRGAAPLGHPRGAARQAAVHVRRLQHRRHGGVGLVAADPVRAGRRGAQAVSQPAASPRRDQRAAGGGARARPQGQAHLQDGDGRGRPSRDVPAPGQEGRLTRYRRE